MANDSKRVSQLGITTAVTANDRVLVLTNPGVTNANTQTITVNSFSRSLVNTAPRANSTQFGVVITSNSTVLSTNGILSVNSLAFGPTAIAGNLSVNGVFSVTGNVIQNFTFANNAKIFGNVNTGINALYAGIDTGYSTVANPVIQASVNVNNYAQINFQNISNGISVSSDIVCTASNGDDFHQFIDMGINGGGWTGDVTDDQVWGQGDGYLYVQGGFGGGHLVLGTTTPGQATKIINGSTFANAVVAVFDVPETQSFNSDTGALVINGGIGANGFVCATDVKVTNSIVFPDSTIMTTAAVSSAIKAITYVTTETYTANTVEEVLLCDPNAAGNNITVTLPVPGANGKVYTVKNINAGGYNVYVQSSDSSSTIEVHSAGILGTYDNVETSGNTVTWVWGADAYRVIAYG